MSCGGDEGAIPRRARWRSRPHFFREEAVSLREALRGTVTVITRMLAVRRGMEGSAARAMQDFENRMENEVRNATDLKV